MLQCKPENLSDSDSLAQIYLRSPRGRPLPRNKSTEMFPPQSRSSYPKIGKPVCLNRGLLHPKVDRHRDYVAEGCWLLALPLCTRRESTACPPIHWASCSEEVTSILVTVGNVYIYMNISMYMYTYIYIYMWYPPSCAYIFAFWLLNSSVFLVKHTILERGQLTYVNPPCVYIFPDVSLSQVTSCSWRCGWTYYTNGNANVRI